MMDIIALHSKLKEISSCFETKAGVLRQKNNKNRFSDPKNTFQTCASKLMVVMLARCGTLCSVVLRGGGRGVIKKNKLKSELSDSKEK